MSDRWFVVSLKLLFVLTAIGIVFAFGAMLAIQLRDGSEAINLIIGVK